jgi:hypothetical protein
MLFIFIKLIILFIESNSYLYMDIMQKFPINVKYSLYKLWTTSLLI